MGGEKKERFREARIEPESWWEDCAEVKPMPEPSKEELTEIP
jgi:hypothetical protein